MIVFFTSIISKIVFFSHRNTEATTIEAKQKQYIKENKDSFQKLISNAKNAGE